VFSEGDPRAPGTTLRQARAAAGDFSRSLGANREWHQLFIEFALHASREPGFADHFRKRETSIRKAIAKVIAERASALGIELPLPPEQLALGIIALANGLALERAVEERNVPDGLFEQLVVLLAAGLAAPARRRPPSDSRRVAR
jgi:hypothetical protein